VARRFVTVANGISPAPRTRPRQAVREALELEGHTLGILHVGSLTRQKAQHVLLEAFASVRMEVPQAVLLIAGDGPLRTALETQAMDLGVLEGVRFLGDRDDVADLMEACDVFVLSSIREGLPVTLLEAMRAGRPSIVTDAGGCPEAVVDGKTGAIVPCGDALALAAAVAGILRDETLMRRMGHAARARWHERFTAERMVGETEALYGLRPTAATNPADHSRISHATP
jgi:glycosyltransferase involved in cell wall biosynthesis